MKPTTFVTFLSGASLATALPTQRSIVTLRLHKTPPARYVADGQAPLNTRGSPLHIAVGQVLSFDHSPLRVQAIEIAKVQPGIDLSSPPRLVEDNSDRVRCKAKLAYGSAGVEIVKGNRSVVIREGGLADVTGIECWLE